VCLTYLRLYTTFAIANIVWRMAYNWRVGRGGGAYIAQWPCTSIAIRWALQVRGRAKKRMIDSHNKSLKCNNILQRLTRTRSKFVCVRVRVCLCACVCVCLCMRPVYFLTYRPTSTVASRPNGPSPSPSIVESRQARSRATKRCIRRFPFRPPGEARRGKATLEAPRACI